MNAVTLRNTHSATVSAVLGASRRVESVGTDFYNQDRWTVLWFLESLFQSRSRDAIPAAVVYANTHASVSRVIRIAATPQEVDDNMVRVLLGGTYHEAWHSSYSCTRDLVEQEMVDLFDNPVVDQVWDYRQQFQTIINVFEDIRIERLGCKAFPGAYSKLECLHDFVLDLEGSANNLERDPFGFLLCGIRDIGLNYPTVKMADRMRGYQASPLWQTLQALEPQIQEAQSLAADDVLGSVRVALQSLPLLIPFLSGADRSDTSSEPGEQFKSTQGALTQWSESVDTLVWDDDKTVYESRSFESPWVETRQAVIPYVSAVKTRLRTLFRSWEQTSVLYGTPKGVLSNRMLVESAISLRAGFLPTRGFEQPAVQMDTSVAATILIDFSGSMEDHLAWLPEVATLLYDTLTGVGATVEVLGYEGGSYDPVSLWTLGKFGAPAHQVLSRIAASRRYVMLNQAGTPTAYGVTWAMSRLLPRRETRKFLFVLTDGEPNNDQRDPLAKILHNPPFPIVGVGLGSAARFVQGAFPHSVWSPQVSDVPQALVSCLQTLLRGRNNVNKP